MAIISRSKRDMYNNDNINQREKSYHTDAMMERGVSVRRRVKVFFFLSLSSPNEKHTN